MRKIVPSKKILVLPDSDYSISGEHLKSRIVLPSTKWSLRNDSTNVNAVLHPNDYKVSSKNASAMEKKLLSSNTCYCREKRIEPKLLPTPKLCLALFDDDLKRSSSTCGKSDKCGESLNEILRKSSVGFKSIEDLVYTKHRQNYEQYRARKEEEERRQIEEEKEEEEEERVGPRTASRISTILGTKDEETNTLATSHIPVTADMKERCLRHLSNRAYRKDEETNTLATSHVAVTADTASLGEFRKSHYLETHDVGENVRRDDGHVCVHTFHIDERLVPEPTYKDVFGRSKCNICAKTMENSIANIGKSFLAPSGKPTKKLLKSRSKCDEYGLLPKFINIGDHNAQMRLQLGDNDVAKFQNFIKKIKKPECCKSYALRHQKMRTY